ncbi:MAG: hypothetical protein H6907_19260 [Hyphomicrobiales bacterium]|nr:hypothetical protein [Hyphomicrobiales bacterium]
MTSAQIQKWVMRGYILPFFTHLFGPSVIMRRLGLQHPPTRPSTRRGGFTFHWFADLANNGCIIDGLVNSLWRCRWPPCRYPSRLRAQG